MKKNYSSFFALFVAFLLLFVGLDASSIFVDKTNDGTLIRVEAATSNMIAAPNEVVAPKRTVNVRKELLSSVVIKLGKGPGTTNAGVAAKIVNNYILPAGKTFSYNDVVGERTEARGFVYGNMPITKNGEKVMIKAVGSGVCRLSVALATIVKGAGLEQIEIHPHKYTPPYFSNNSGLVDATVYWQVLDNKFKNNKDFDVKIKCWIDEKYALHAELYKLIYFY